MDPYRILLPPLLLVLTGCGTSSGDEPEGSGAAGPGDGDLSEMTPSGGNASGGNASGGNASGGAGAGGSGGSGTGGASMTGGATSGGDTVPSDLYPMAVGNTWTYVVEEKTAGSCPEEQRTISFLEEEFLDGRDTFVGTHLCTPGYTARQAIQGDVIEQYSEDGASWFVSYQVPLEDGFEWSPFDGTTLRWEEVGSFTVPAGTFEDCWRRVVVGTNSQNTYCAGVGMIRSEIEAYIAELESYSLVR